MGKDLGWRVKKRGRFLKKAAQKLFETGPMAMKPARPEINEVFLLLFVHKK
jgi:hypothetical protein